MQGWAQLVAVKSRQLAVIPEEVSFEDAATLPVAGLTALYGLERCSRLLGTKVVVTGARGGVGFFACQLAVAMGARVFAQVRASEHVAMFEDVAVEQVVVDSKGDALGALGPFRLVLDGVGGPMLGQLVQCLEADGRAVAYGVSDSTSTEVAVRELMLTGSGRLEGFHLYRESEIVSAGSGLARLLQLMRDSKLRTLISQVDDWSQVGDVANALIERAYPGKAVLTLP
jgi:NADPH:quinone reductase-like Zn-dependent oxidoreductase